MTPRRLLLKWQARAAYNYMRRDGLPCWVESASAAAEKNERRNTSFLQGTACLLHCRLAINWRVAEKSSPAKLSEHTTVLAVAEK